MRDEWEALFGDDTDDEKEAAGTAVTEEAVEEPDPPHHEETEDEPDDIEDQAEEADTESKDRPKKKAPKKKPVKKVHGLKRKEKKEEDPYDKEDRMNHNKLVIAVIGVVAVAAAVGAGGLVASSRIRSVNETNENLTQQIASRTKNVYTAKRDLQAGDAIVTTGEPANVELSQVYTSLSDSAYISADESGYLKVDIEAGLPVMSYDVGDTSPVDDLNNAVDEATSVYRTAKVMPYKITADFIDLETGNSIAESRDLLLDDGANEKAFNTEAESVDGYILKSIQVDGESTHAYGVSEKSMKEGSVSMYYYTTKGGWGRHEIKGNIRVTYGYQKVNDAASEEEATTDIFDDSQWIDNSAEAAAEESADTEATLDAENDAVDAEFLEDSAASTGTEPAQ